MSNLLKDIASKIKEDINQPDNTANVRDVHAAKPNINFPLMKNLLDKETVSPNDVSTYLDAAHEKNDEIDTVAFGLETDENEIVKVYVNAKDADEFEKAMGKLLGKEDNIELAIDELARTFDIVDVEWPNEENSNDEVDSAEEDDSEEFLTNKDIDLEPIDAAAEVTPEDEEDEEPKDEPEDELDLDSEEEPKDKEPKDKEPKDNPEDELGLDSEDEEDLDLDSEDKPEDEIDLDSEIDLGLDSKDKKDTKSKKKAKKKDKDEKDTKKLENLKGEFAMVTLGQRFKQRFLNEAKKEEDEDDGVDDSFYGVELSSEEKELEDVMTGINAKKIFNLILLLGMPIDILALRKTTLRQNLRSAGRDMAKNSGMRMWANRLIKELAEYEQKLKVNSKSKEKPMAIEDDLVKEESSLEDQLTNKIQTTLYHVLLGLGVPEVLMTSRKSRIRMAIRLKAMQLTRKNRQKTYLNNLARAMGKDTEAVDPKAIEENVKSETIFFELQEALAKRRGRPPKDKYQAPSGKREAGEVLSSDEDKDEMDPDLKSAEDVEKDSKKRAKRDEILADDLGEWNISEFGSSGGLVLSAGKFTVKLAAEEAEKLIDTFAEAGAINVRGSNGRYGFRPIKRGLMYVVKKIGDTKFPNGVIMHKETIDAVIDFIGGNT